MKVVVKVAVLGLAGFTALGAAGCNRDGGSGGKTTIIQQAPPNNGGAATSTSTTPSVIPINDGKKLCSLLRGRGSELIGALDAFSEAIPRASSGQKSWSWGDPKISGAGDHAKQVVDKDAPILEGSVGPDAPKEIADAIRNFAKAAKDYADAINNRYDIDQLNPVNDQFTDAVNKGRLVCQA